MKEKKITKPSDKSKKYFCYQDEKFRVEIEVLDRWTSSIICNISFRLKDERKTILKHQSDGLFDRMIYDKMKPAAKAIMSNTKHFKQEHILLIEIPQIVKQNNNQFNAFIELYLYTPRKWEFSFTTKDTIPQVQELENEILMKLLGELMVVLEDIQKIIEN